MFNFDLAIAKAVDMVINTITTQDVSALVPLAPWELLHHKNLSNALLLSRLTNTSLDVSLSFTRDKQEMVLRSKLEGNRNSVCAFNAEILPVTLEKWLQLGGKGISPFYQFVLQFNKAKGLAESKFVRDLHYTKDGKGAMFWLERMESDEWADKSKSSNININQETTIRQVPLSEMKPDQKKQFFEEIIKNNKNKIIDAE